MRDRKKSFVLRTEKKQMPKLFEKGTSGNPGGRPKQSIHFAELAREHTKRALDILVACLDSQNEKNRIQAASIIIERGWGKPLQEIQGLQQQIIISATIQKQVPGEPENTNRMAEYFSGPPYTPPT